ncbi:transcription antitermination factor NusB [Frankia sp. Cppng1_Ct_nod]|uniref:transcription antitermination factor NusB n=1 Tax=Frankia sp. Cppng1_Ct_nod TaxID=2897162 RepID=UPI0010415962|nr:transcription antitermination factor NusB [Frankia sp. Cppng1_Ct_nod]
MSARSKARKRALDILYEADLRGSSFTETLAARLVQSDPPVPEYAVSLVEGVAERLADIDEMLSDYAEEWTLERMPAVDRNILRIGALELLWREDIPDGVAIDEAVELAKLVSTERSPVFVNGLLARLLDLKLGRTSR